VAQKIGPLSAHFAPAIIVTVAGLSQARSAGSRESPIGETSSLARHCSCAAAQRTD